MTRLSRYAQVAARLRDRILSGHWGPGTVLPTEARLGKEFGISRITVRQALALLDEEGLIRRHQGSGTYVSPHPTRRIPLQIDYTGSIRAHAPQLRRKVLRFRREGLGREQAGTLGCEAGAAALYAERLDCLGPVPVAYDQAYIAPAYATRLTRSDLARVDFIEVWSRRQRIRIVTCRQTVEAVASSETVANRLGLPAGAPVLRSSELYHAAPSGPAGLFISYYHPGHICIASTYHWGRPFPVS